MLDHVLPVGLHQIDRATVRIGRTKEVALVLRAPAPRPFDLEAQAPERLSSVAEDAELRAHGGQLLAVAHRGMAFLAPGQQLDCDALGGGRKGHDQAREAAGDDAADHGKATSTGCPAATVSVPLIVSTPGRHA